MPTGLFERSDDPFIGIIGLVGNHRMGGHIGQQNIRTIQIASLSWRQKEAGGVAHGIDGGVDFGA